MIHDEESSNESGNRKFIDVVQAASSRRSFLTGTISLAAATFIAPSLGAKLPMNNMLGSRGAGESLLRKGRIEFNPVPISEGSGPMPTISSDYEYQVLIPWGTPLEPGVPEYTGDPDTRPSAAEQERMVGVGHDGMHFFPIAGRNREGILAINHEFGTNNHVLGKAFPESDEDIRLSQAAHGVAMVHIRRNQEGWKVVTDSPYNRRITPNTPVVFSGPARGSSVIAPETRAKGTVNNCSSGYTPWGTYLTCEENFNGYFGDSQGSWTPTEEQERYGFAPSGFGYGWETHSTDRRFDLSSAQYPNEDNRFGWVVEIDPMAPNEPPVKRTALGRFKHEGVAIVEGKDGRIVAYMGDDQRFDYIYKFVSARNWEEMRAEGLSPLDRGRLYVAKFNDDGTGEWLWLTMRNPVLAERFGSQAEILTYARVAADLLGATPMDRPEWTAVAPNGDVYCTLTNNSRREEPNTANPLAPNEDGHIIRWRDTGNHVGTRFSWDIFAFAQDTHAEGDERTFSDPDGLWVDPGGRMFIQTDGGQMKGLNNQMLVCSVYDDGGAQSMDIKRLFTGVTGDEITGLTTTPDRRTMFINTQHPGNGDPLASNFPAEPDGVTIPRDSTIIITRKDGRVVGS